MKYRIKYVRVSFLHLQTNPHIPSCNVLLVTVIKQKAKDTISHDVKFLLHILEKI